MSLKGAGSKGKPSCVAEQWVRAGGAEVCTPIILGSGGVMAPGDYPVLATGTLTSGAVTWPSGGHYFCAINDTNSTACTLISCGLLTITATPSAPFLIELAVATTTNPLGLRTNFNPNASYSWTIVSASGGISGFDPTAFIIRSSAGPNRGPDQCDLRGVGYRRASAVLPIVSPGVI